MLTIAPCALAPGAAPPPARGTAARAGWSRSAPPSATASIAPTATGIEARGVVHQQVEPPKRSSAACTSARGAIGASSSAFTFAALLRARRVELRLELRRVGFGAAVVQHHVRAGGVQAARDRGADAARGAGHQCRLSPAATASMDAVNSRVNSPHASELPRRSASSRARAMRRLPRRLDLVRALHGARAARAGPRLLRRRRAQVRRAAATSSPRPSSARCSAARSRASCASCSGRRDPRDRRRQRRARRSRCSTSWTCDVPHPRDEPRAARRGSAERARRRACSWLDAPARALQRRRHRQRSGRRDAGARASPGRDARRHGARRVR